MDSGRVATIWDLKIIGIGWLRENHLTTLTGNLESLTTLTILTNGA